jgi:SAM-dependent methyltransferase
MTNPETIREDEEQQGLRRAKRRQAWTRYWSLGPLHSLGTTFAGSYADSIGTFWQREFLGCAADTRILDIGCGNGPLADILLKLHPESGPSICGVDLANPAPAWWSKLPLAQRGRVEFRGGVAVESLPFPDAAFDLVASQFGIEYSDLGLSLPEVLRVLKPGGRIAFMVHHADSLPVIVSRHELRHLDFLEAEDGFLQQAAAMLPYMARLATMEGRVALQADNSAAEVRRRFDAAKAALDERAGTEPIPDVLTETQSAVAEAFRSAAAAGDVASGRRVLRVCQTRLEDSRLRLQDLVSSGLSEARVTALLAALRRPDVTSEAVPLTVNEHVFGWAIRA